MGLPQISNEQVIAFIRKNPIGVGCGVLCIALAVFFYIRMDAIPQAEATLQAKTEEASRYALNIRNAAQLKEQSDAVFEAAKLIDARLIRASALATNLQYFYKLEAETGAKVGSDLKQNVIVTVKGAKPTLYLAVPYSFSVQGDYLRLISFLRKLENDTYFCRINSATLSSSLAGGQSFAAGGAAPSEDQPEDLLTLSLNLELVGVP